MSSKLHELKFDTDSFGRVLGPAGLNDLLQDIHRGYHARAAVQAIEQQQAGAIARQLPRKPGSFFAVEEVFTELDFQFWIQEEGDECWQDETGFIHEKRRDVPDCIVSTGKAPSNSIIVPATKWGPARDQKAA